MTNDILEQLAEDYFRHLGYFTQHNVKYRPNKKGPAFAVHSDIDIVGVHPKRKGVERVVVASCKSWYGGLGVEKHLRRIKSNYRNTRKTFRELSIPIWSNALREEVKRITGQKNFCFYLVVTKFENGKKDIWEQNKFFNKNLKGCEIHLLDMQTMLEEILGTLTGVTPAHDELTRLLQMINYSGAKINYKDKK